MNKKALQKISYGLYVICSRNGENVNGQIANALFQVTANPATIAVSINKQNCTHDYIQNSKQFSVSILSEKTPMTFIGTFGFKCGREIDKFENRTYKLGKINTPILTEYSIAYIEAQLIESIDIGTHTIFIGKVIDAEVLSEEEPMTYKYYHLTKGGIAPKNAPTYINRENDLKKNEKEEVAMEKYVCNICGYVYEPDKGDPDNNIKPGTSFEDLPDDWVCPVCGAPKSEFSKEE